MKLAAAANVLNVVVGGLVLSGQGNIIGVEAIVSAIVLSLSEGRGLYCCFHFNVLCPWKRYSTHKPLFYSNDNNLTPSTLLCFELVHTLVSPLSITACECIMIIFPCAHIFSLFYLQVLTLVSPLSITVGECIMIIYFLVHTSFLSFICRFSHCTNSSLL